MGLVCRVWSARCVLPVLCLCRECVVSDSGCCGSLLLHLAAKACAGRPQRFSEAVGASHRLPCDARGRGPSHNSLRSLRSLCSDKCDKSDDEARCARGHGHCASRRLTGALRPARTHLGKQRCWRATGGAPIHLLLRQALSGGGDFWGGCDRQPGAGRASARFVSDSRPLSERRERSERSERSEFGRAGSRLVGAAESAQSADRPSMSPRRAAPAAAARCNDRNLKGRPQLSARARGCACDAETRSPDRPRAA